MMLAERPLSPALPREGGGSKNEGAHLFPSPLAGEGLGERGDFRA